MNFRVRVALTEDGVPMSTLREIALLKQLDGYKHPNIVKYECNQLWLNYNCLIDFISRILHRLLDVCHGQIERERQLVLFLVFEHLEEDLAGYLNRVGEHGMTASTIQVCAFDSKLSLY